MGVDWSGGIRASAIDLSVVIYCPVLVLSGGRCAKNQNINVVVVCIVSPLYFCT